MSHFSDQYITDCDNRTSDDDYLDRRDGVSSIPVLPTPKSKPTYDKIITPHFEQNGRRKRLTGYLAELHDGNILLHSQEYSTNSQAEQALDRIVYDLLTDLHEHGLVDDVPAALEAEQVSSTHLPSWATCKNCKGPHHTWQCPEIGDLLFELGPCIGTPITPSCGRPSLHDVDHGLIFCEDCFAHMFAPQYRVPEPVVMVPDVEYAPFGFAA